MVLVLFSSNSRSSVELDVLYFSLLVLLSTYSTYSYLLLPLLPTLTYSTCLLLPASTCSTSSASSTYFWTVDGNSAWPTYGTAAPGLEARGRWSHGRCETRGEDSGREIKRLPLYEFPREIVPRGESLVILL